MQKNYNYNYVHYTDRHGSETVIALSTYAGKTVRGVARCNPVDQFDLEKGKELAAARCNQAVSIKRAKRAAQKLQEAEAQLALAQAHLDKMRKYVEDAEAAKLEAIYHHNQLIKEL